MPLASIRKLVPRALRNRFYVLQQAFTAANIERRPLGAVWRGRNRVDDMNERWPSVASGRSSIMAVGIGVHQANMGWWNIAMNVLACAAVIFLCVSGTLLWWLRRPAGSRPLPVAPRIAGLPLRSGLTVLLVVMGVAFPLLGAALLAGLLVHRVVPIQR